jgi:hypothetical protein
MKNWVHALCTFLILYTRIWQMHTECSIRFYRHTKKLFVTCFTAINLHMLGKSTRFYSPQIMDMLLLHEGIRDCIKSNTTISQNKTSVNYVKIYFKRNLFLGWLVNTASHKWSCGCVHSTNFLVLSGRTYEIKDNALSMLFRVEIYSTASTPSPRNIPGWISILMWEPPTERKESSGRLVTWLSSSANATTENTSV